jgi:magnesium and cobalt transporter
MGESTDASSNAARGAQAESQDSDDEQSGFFRRLFDAFNPNEDDEDEDGANPQGAGVLGLGNLRTLTVEDVAIPTSDIVAVPVDITKDDLVKVFRESGLSRLPVYDGTLDSPIGMAHLKDFALSHGFNGGSGRFTLRKMLRPLLYVPPSMSIGVLLQNMQSERRHMALVIDEYGGVDGLVTIEDLIEQVVGEIEDEHDETPEEMIVAIGDGMWDCDARAELEDVAQIVDPRLEEVEEAVDTLGGLAFVLAEAVPQVGAILEHPSGWRIEVTVGNETHVKRLRLHPPVSGVVANEVQ